jgi:hypothetical protein
MGVQYSVFTAGYGKEGIIFKFNFESKHRYIFIKNFPDNSPEHEYCGLLWIEVNYSRSIVPICIHPISEMLGRLMLW